MPVLNGSVHELRHAVGGCVIVAELDADVPRELPPSSSRSKAEQFGKNPPTEAVTWSKERSSGSDPH